MTAGRAEAQLLGCGVAATAVLTVAIVGRWPDLVPWPIAFLAGLFAAALLLRDGGIDGLAPLYGAGLIATAELTYWSLNQAPATGGRAIVLRRVASIGALAAAGATAGTAVLAVSDAAPPGGLGVELVGVLAAVGAVSLLAWLAWNQR